MKTKIAMVLTMVAPLVASAADLKPLDVKTGLWETTAKTEIGGLPARSMPQIPEDRLAAMPPEQRARIEAMMKGRGMTGAQSTTTKSCLTRESLERGFNLHNEKSCVVKLNNSSSSRQELHLECTRGANQTAGDLTIERVDAEHVKGNMLMKSSGNAGISVKMTFDTKFVSPDCGDVKPLGAK